MRLHSSRADPQDDADLLVRPALSQVPQYFALTRRERRARFLLFATAIVRSRVMIVDCGSAIVIANRRIIHERFDRIHQSVPGLPDCTPARLFVSARNV